MKYIINKEEMKREWSLDRWYEKVMYLVGIFYSVCFIVGFVVGFVTTLAN